MYRRILSGTLLSAILLSTKAIEDRSATCCLGDPSQHPSRIGIPNLGTGCRFWVNPFSLMLPLLAATIVSGQIVAIVVLAIRAI